MSPRRHTATIHRHTPLTTPRTSLSASVDSGALVIIDPSYLGDTGHAYALEAVKRGLATMVLTGDGCFPVDHARPDLVTVKGYGIEFHLCDPSDPATAWVFDRSDLPRVKWGEC